MPSSDTRPLAESYRDRLRAAWRGPRSFTALVPVPGVPFTELRDRLRTLQPGFGQALPAVTDLHSFRLCAVPPADGASARPRVLVNLVHDRPLREHAVTLLRVAGHALAEAFAAPGLDRRPDDLPALLARHRIREYTLHLGGIGLTVPEILANQRLRKAAGAFVDRNIASGRWDASTPAETIRLETRRHVLDAPEGRDMPRGPIGPLPLRARLLRLLDLIASFSFPALGVLDAEIRPAIQRVSGARRRAAYAAAYAAWWLYGALPTTLALLGVRYLERTEPDVVGPPPDEELLATLESSEDVDPKNEVTLWFPVRPTRVRRLLLRVILWGSERGCRHFWTDGRLANIETIHYARILAIGGGRTMAFLSDYDGGLNRYLGDFLGAGSNAVIPISSNVDGCPKTRWLFRPADPNEFGARWRDLIRRYQLETSVWYTAYPLLTVVENLDNVRFRNELFAERLDESDAARWARRL